MNKVLDGLAENFQIANVFCLTLVMMMNVCMYFHSSQNNILYTGEAPIMQYTHVRTCVIQIVTLKGAHIMWKK